jgi:hypothetical protein
MPITLNGTSGITTPGLINTGSTTFVDLTTTGNTILGDASTDTLNVANGNLVLNSSGNLGVGTASPASKLDVRGNSASTTVMVGAYVYNENTTTNSQTGLGFFNYDNFGAKIYALRSGSSAGNLVFATNGGGGVGESNVAERARIDSSGNMGIGTSSPNAGAKLTVAGGILATGAFSSTTGSTGGFDYSAPEGLRFFSMGASGATKGAYSFIAKGADGSSSQPITIDSSGNLGVGTTSPSTFGKVAVEVAGTTTPTSLTTVGPSSINLYAATNGGSTNGTTGIFGWAATTGIGSGIGFSRESSVDWGTQIRFYTHPTATSNIGDITERARIDSSGNFMVGTTSASRFIDFEKNQNASTILRVGNTTSGTGAYSALQLSSSNPTYLYNFSNAYTTSGMFAAGSTLLDAGGSGGLGLNANSVGIIFYTGSTARARINSSGNFGVANTGPEYLVDVGSNSPGAYLRAQGAYLSRKYTFDANISASRVIRLTISLNGLQFTNIFMDASAHYYTNGGLWQAQRYAFQVMTEQSAFRHNIRMPNYEYGGSTAGVFTVGNPPSWTYVTGNTWYFDFTAVAGYVPYIALSAEGPGIVDLTLTVIS